MACKARANLLLAAGRAARFRLPALDARRSLRFEHLGWKRRAASVACGNRKGRREKGRRGGFGRLASPKRGFKALANMPLNLTGAVAT